MSDVSQWNVTDASNTSNPPAGAPEGIAPSTLNDILRAMMGALARWYSDSDGTLETGGTGNAYTLTTNATHAALADIPLLVFRVDRANTGASTLNVDSLGAKSMRLNGTALASGQLVADTVVCAAYNATDDVFEVFGPQDNNAANLTGEIDDARLSANVPLLDAANVFTGNFLELSRTAPQLNFTETDATADNGKWRLVANNEGFFGLILNDTATVSTNWLQVNRTGTTVDSIVLTATSITANGSEVLTPAEVAAATAIEGNALVGSDSFYVNDNGQAKQMLYQSAGLRVVTKSASATLVDGEMNAYIIADNASAMNITLNTGIGVQGNVLLIKQAGAGQVTVNGTATLESSVGTKTRAQNSVIALVNEGSDVWSVSGDAST